MSALRYSAAEANVTFGWRPCDSSPRLHLCRLLYYIQNREYEVPMESLDLQADFLKAISHPTRLAVLEILRDGEQCVCHM